MKDYIVPKGQPLEASKQLSDEEITEVLIEKGIWSRLKDGGLCAWQEDADLHDFARAILKKASEE